jgi:hypothetical protein
MALFLGDVVAIVSAIAWLICLSAVCGVAVLFLVVICDE